MPRGEHTPGPVTSKLVLRTLGGAEATALSAAGERTGRFGAGKPLALLAYLCASPNRSAPREHLVELLWGDVDLDAARHALRQTIWYVRKTLGAAVLRTEGDIVQLAVACESDALEFLQATGARDEDRALAIYGGDFLAGIAIPGGGEFERWADLERMRLRSIFTRSAESRVLQLLARGETRAALPVARRARDADPGDERLWRRLFEVLIAARDPLGAAAEADAFERLWLADDREPEASTRALLRRARNEIATTGGSVEDAPATAVVAALVGRAEEFAALTGAWEDVRHDRQLRHVHISAPAGLGKTRLLGDFRSRLRAARSRVVLARANPGERAIPYALVAEITRLLAELPGAAAIAPETASVLVRLNPALSALFPQASSSGLEQEPLRRRTVALRELAAAVTDERPAALLVDDLHWADRESLAVLAAWADNSGGARLLLVTSGRAPGRQWFANDLHELALSPLDPRAVTEFVASLGELPDEPWSDRLPLLLTGASSGSPLLVLETLQLAMERDLLRLRDGYWECADVDALERLLIRTDPLASRLGQLDEEDGRLLGLLAAAGVPCPTPILALAASVASDVTERVLQALELRGLVQHTDAGWMPAHDEIAAAVLVTLGDEAAARARLAVARAIASNPSADLSTLRVAAELLLAGDEVEELAELFARFTRVREAAGIHASAEEHLQALVGDLLPRDTKRRLLRAAPLHTRVTRRRAMAAAMLLASLGGAAWWRADRAADVALHLTGIETDSAAAAPVTLDLAPSMDLRRGILDLASDAKPLALPAHGTAYDLVPSPLGTGWYGTLTYADGGNDDLVFVARDGALRRLDRSAGDDNARAVSPDGARLAFTTSRYSAQMVRSTAVLSLASGTVQRLFADSLKSDPIAFQPNGSHLLIVRVDRANGAQQEACVVGLDGTGMRCFDGGYPIGWRSDAQILAVALTTDPALIEISYPAGQVRTVCERVRFAWVSPDRQWLLLHGIRDGIDGPVYWLSRADAPCDGAVLAHGGSLVRALRPTWQVLRPSDEWLARIDITAPDTVSSISPVALWAAGTTQAGRTFTATDVTWASLDTTIATVSADGVLMPRDNGTARIIASDGGWRADTARIVVARRSASLRVRTSWAGPSDLPPWYVFGVPRPSIRPVDGATALSLNGDSTYSSGIRLRQSLRVAEGVALRARVRMRVTAPQWQVIEVALATAAADSSWSTWDLATGGAPQPAAGTFKCSLHYPSGEGPASRGLVGTFDIMRLEARAAPATLAGGDWTWVEVQVLPDGRCGYALDGVPIALTRDRQPVGRPVEARVHGYSHRTTTLVDTVEVYQGVLHPTWWTALDMQRITAERQRGAASVPGDAGSTSPARPRAPTAPPARGPSSRP